MKIRRAELVGLGIVILSFVAVAAFYDRLPAVIATHWDSRGVANGFMPKAVGSLVLPMSTAFVYVLYLVIPRISPRGFGIARFQAAYDAIHLALMALLFTCGTVMLLIGAGIPVPVGRVVPTGVGVLFLILGNFMGKLTKNFFVGIRTPWTLANDEVWLRTHRLAGKLFAVAGLGIAISGLVGTPSTIPILVGVAVAAGIPVVYSYVLYRKLEGNGASRPRVGRR
jgi:uncharacterized membrane protein